MLKNKRKASQQEAFALTGSLHDLENKNTAQQLKMKETCHLQSLLRKTKDQTLLVIDSGVDQG